MLEEEGGRTQKRAVVTVYERESKIGTRYVAGCHVNGRNIHLGTYDTRMEAEIAVFAFRSERNSNVDIDKPLHPEANRVLREIWR